LVVTLAEIGGHARIDTLRIYTQPTDEDKLAALDRLTVDRRAPLCYLAARRSCRSP
jgi:hypothetical protein